MELTGPWFIGLVATLTAAAFVAALAVWPHLAGKTVGTMLGRAGTLLSLNLLVLLVAAIALNNQFTFFADWTDLAGALGDTQQTVTTAHSGATAADAASVPLGGSPSDPTGGQGLPGSPTFGRRILRFTVVGPVSRIRASVMVELPAAYDSPANLHRRYPVLETFNGYPGDLSAWIRGLGLGGAVSRAVNLRQLSDMVIVSPTLEVPPGQDTECVNSPRPGDPQVETWLTQDVPAWVMKTFRVRPDRESWATIGLSAGGWCAAMAAMLHPSRYAAAIVLGGYFRPDFGPRYKPFPPNSPWGRRYDLVSLASSRPPPVALWVQTSHTDSLSYPSSSQLLRRARPPLSVTSVVLAHAGHRVSLWRGLLPQTLTWLGANVPGFMPGAVPAGTLPAGAVPAGTLPTTVTRRSGFVAVASTGRPASAHRPARAAAAPPARPAAPPATRPTARR